MLESYKWMGMGMGMGWDGRKSLKGVILRAPLCGANNVLSRSFGEKLGCPCASVGTNNLATAKVFSKNHKICAVAYFSRKNHNKCTL